LWSKTKWFMRPNLTRLATNHNLICFSWVPGFFCQCSLVFINVSLRYSVFFLPSIMLSHFKQSSSRWLGIKATDIGNLRQLLYTSLVKLSSLLSVAKWKSRSIISFKNSLATSKQLKIDKDSSIQYIDVGHQIKKIMKGKDCIIGEQIL